MKLAYIRIWSQSVIWANDLCQPSVHHHVYVHVIYQNVQGKLSHEQKVKRRMKKNIYQNVTNIVDDVDWIRFLSFFHRRGIFQHQLSKLLDVNHLKLKKDFAISHNFLTKKFESFLD